jgi:glycosyltransferase involved in cell wall biosynthesis
MIYVDVTSSCESPMNTGVQRMARGLFRNLRAHYPVTPLRWEPSLRSYCVLSPRERGFLEKPFAGLLAHKARAVPGRLANPIPLWSKFRRQSARRRFDLPAHLHSGDIFLVPEIFPDNRIDWLENVSRKTNTQWIAFFHDAITWRRPELTSDKRRQHFTDYMKALASFDKVVAVSEEAADDLRNFWDESGDDSRIQLNPWPVDDQFATPMKESPLGFEKNRPNVLCVGTLEARKNHLTLFQASEKIWRECGPVFELILIGRKTAEFGDRVIAELRRMRRAGQPVRWHRHVDDEKLLATYDGCAFTVFPSLAEGFGLPIIESLRRGRPCLCGENGALGERARNGGCLTVDQTNAAALAEAMQRLLTDEELYSRLCREASARHFDTWEDFIARLRPLFSPEASLVCA